MNLTLDIEGMNGDGSKSGRNGREPVLKIFTSRKVRVTCLAERIRVDNGSMGYGLMSQLGRQKLMGHMGHRPTHVDT
jgi:hypothetical protein